LRIFLLTNSARFAKPQLLSSLPARFPPTSGAGLGTILSGHATASVDLFLLGPINDWKMDKKNGQVLVLVPFFQFQIHSLNLNSLES